MPAVKRARMGSGVALAALMGGFIVAGPAARADNAPAPVAANPGAKADDEMVKKVAELKAGAEKHKQDRSDDAAVADIVAAAKLAVTVSDPKLKSELIRLVGDLMATFPKKEVVSKAGIKALGEIGESSGYQFIKIFCIQEDTKKAPPLIDEALKAASLMKSDMSVYDLMKLVEQSDVIPVAVSAIRAFATFGQNKMTREKILSDLIDTVKKDRPGISYRWKGGQGPDQPPDRYRTRIPPIRTGEAARNRYEGLGGEMTTTLNKMTGQNVASPEDWFDLRDKYKTDLSQLFKAGPAK